MRVLDLVGKPSPTYKDVLKKHGMSAAQLDVQLALGIDTELEHTNSRAEAREIALDHLAELPDYYTRLRDMERGV